MVSDLDQQPRRWLCGSGRFGDVVSRRNQNCQQTVAPISAHTNDLLSKNLLGLLRTCWSRAEKLVHARAGLEMNCRTSGQDYTASLAASDLVDEPRL